MAGLGLGLERRVPWGHLQEVGDWREQGVWGNNRKAILRETEAVHGMRWRSGLDCVGMKPGRSLGTSKDPGRRASS